MALPGVLMATIYFVSISKPFFGRFTISRKLGICILFPTRRIESVLSHIFSFLSLSSFRANCCPLSEF